MLEAVGFVVGAGLGWWDRAVRAVSRPTSASVTAPCSICLVFRPGSGSAALATAVYTVVRLKSVSASPADRGGRNGGEAPTPETTAVMTLLQLAMGVECQCPSLGSLIVTQLPLWAVYVVAFGTPLCALAGVLIGQWLGRRTALEADDRAKREELMRTLRWAAELASSSDERKTELGVAQLTALGESSLLDAGDQIFIDAALSSVIREPREEIDEIEAAGGQVDVVEDAGDQPPQVSAIDLPLALETEEGER